MSRAIFQAGVSWAAIDRQWDALCLAFDGFDPWMVARYTDADIRRIKVRAGILRSEPKARAVIHNARMLLELERAYGGFEKYLRSFRSYGERVADIKRRFSRIGDVSAYYFLYRVGERVPPFGRWAKTVEGDHPRIREMVGRARAHGPKGA